MIIGRIKTHRLVKTHLLKTFVRDLLFFDVKVFKV